MRRQRESCQGHAGVQASAGAQASGSLRASHGDSGAGSATLAAELEAFALRSSCRLATCAALETAFAVLDDKSTEATQYEFGDKVKAILIACLDTVTSAARFPAALSGAQLLACQPHRLLAAACTQLCGSRASMATQQQDSGWPVPLSAAAVRAVIALSAHPELSRRVRAWLVPTDAEVAPFVEVELAGAGPEERGCLAALIDVGLLPTTTPNVGVCLERLVDAAFGGPANGPHGGIPLVPGAEADPDGGFRSTAAHLSTMLQCLVSGGTNCIRPGCAMDVVRAVPVGKALGEESTDTLYGCCEVDDFDRQRAVLDGPLAPPLAAPLVLTKLRACGNPGCLNFSERCEAELRLKQCGGCKAVRYCGEGCQSAHWRSGHKAECKAMAAAVRAAQGMSQAP
ncbi:hypothetical protein HYH03_003902 [Edaphochlamys debaryana]|uniref:phytol kinase n=1 Tax=Edaphochlamys debaryana TaxID=47281 RepID=A0A836C3X1_9CHLO|nr:hypothetical protein HYH03_003902 [Edaphochlamys debaryana]|eukprot:KAG2498144.1 hypothetical protein HYH03_003902 [Edaphochlamys debaryana]